MFDVHQFLFRSDWTLAARGGARMKFHEIHAIFMKFHTRLQSTDFVVVLVPYKILIHENKLEDENNQIRSHTYAPDRAG
jgi:hypothetical protein